MYVAKLVSEKAQEHCRPVSRQTDEDLQHEYDYLAAIRLIETMLEKDLITVDECTKLRQKCLEFFSPFLAEIA